MAEFRRTPPMVLSPSVEGAAFVIGAIREHAKRFRINGAVVPEEVWDLERLLTSGATQGQVSSSSAPASRTEQVSPMTPLCVTYETAAELLSLSLSSLKRRISAGELHPVYLGGSARIRVAELTALAAAGSEDSKTKRDI